ncbi:hypothetical protein DMN91_011576 [Ooceraea biroi]|uniref:Uncharacterized protein n=1 Tax=Ooceraea biroi TaxID=2015173 RepID=A0A3L8D5Y3_OOCBI|nr:uncharacterized protein LOC105279537 [Ooceraea biroi]RLU15820.1 hypothetical protein DMN91_011576 [Ooceraea biroi]
MLFARIIYINKDFVYFYHGVLGIRLPTNPSWPKIPRRLTNSANNIIEPPCVITLMGTCTKTCNTMRAITCQHSKPKCEAVTQMPKRLSGCLDPRFRSFIVHGY